MGTALQTPNPRVSDVLASILHEAPVGLSALEVDSLSLAEKYCVSVKRRHALALDNERRERERYADPLMGQCASVTTCHCVLPVIVVLAAHLTRSTMAPMGSRGGVFGYLPSHGGRKEERKRKKETSTCRMWQDTTRIFHIDRSFLDETPLMKQIGEGHWHFTFARLK